jgi:hypothetical protein
MAIPTSAMVELHALRSLLGRTPLDRREQALDLHEPVVHLGAEETTGRYPAWGLARGLRGLARGLVGTYSRRVNSAPAKRIFHGGLGRD